ncbi:GDP-L-fucose synthase [Kluyvera cryocrescens]|uniref:GDP-L-fucose synthase n=1 Tax=Kluyvera cryocrescens TaxID=580 RepID=A0A485C7N6_KLUCR|nr:GDP-L-fucose synthase [Kluyvera cryocrescens]
MSLICWTAREVNDFFARENIDQVYLAAAKVGGIVANNTFPADFIYENMMIESNIIHAAHSHNVNKLLFLRFIVHLSEDGEPADARKRTVAGDARGHQ